MYCLFFPVDPQVQKAEPRYYSLVAPFGQEGITIKLTARDVKLVEDASTKRVYKAKLHSKLFGYSPRRVVCKCATGPQIKSLLHEATVYQSKLTDLQGVYVPRYVGIFHGEHPDGYDVAIMVLEDGGQAIKYMLKYAPLYFRYISISYPKLFGSLS
ncbi:hypothetical protein OH76DRAFT_290537 [Lentinus brumalis]|uniref:Uncharacterized protein n=1 Tax=Lentinus brumalis TaxID=2498619 RepID=A0A371DFV0_9APHY|nr:hypothetical protein OH76DRAFT_290537 [Polyporus brumalis]